MKSASGASAQATAINPALGRDRSRWPDRSINHVFRDVAERHADHVAIRTLDGEITYANFEERICQLARALPAERNESQPRIAILFEHGADAIAAIFATLRAGFAYVPLDPRDPPARMQFILQDSSARAILTDSAHSELAGRLSGGNCRIINIDDTHGGSVALDRDVAPDALAYLFFTSGSTGQPKGVMQSHRNLLHFAGVYSQALRIAPGDCCSLLYTLSFSAANMDIYGALLNGATLCPLDVRKLGAAGLAARMAEQGVTVLHTVPTLFRHLAGNLPGDFRFNAIRAIDLGGEPLHPADLRLWPERFPACTIFLNHLAATEASVIAQYAATPDDERGSETIPVGSAAPGIEIRIARDDGADAAPGEAGEIVISSPYASPGYWNRSEQTAAAFSDDPARPGWRIYRSGDLGKLDAGGLLHTLGRRDERVKIRGHSVYLSEVEAALRGIDGVRDAAVVAIRSNSEGPQSPTLAAYAVTDSLDARALRRALAAFLPDYMLPGELVLLDDLPRTATGKIDRKLLSGPDRPRPQLERIVDPPENPSENTIAETYARLLGLERVGRNEDFFELGGTSLKTAELQTELHRVFGREPPLKDLLQNATVAGVSLLMERLREFKGEGASHSPLLVPLRETGSRRPLFLVHGALGQAFISPSFLKALGEDQPLYGFHARGVDGSGKPHRSISAMAADYVAALRQVQPEGPYFIGGLCTGGIVAQEMACQLIETGLQVLPLLVIDPPIPPGELSWLNRFKRLWVLHASKLPIMSKAKRKTLRRIKRGLQAHLDERRIAIDPRDDTALEAGVREALNFKIALLGHRLRPFSGTMFVLGSRARLASVWNGAGWTRRFSGDTQLIETGEWHSEVLDPANEVFAARLRECIEAAQSAPPISA